MDNKDKNQQAEVFNIPEDLREVYALVNTGRMEEEWFCNYSFVAQLIRRIASVNREKDEALKYRSWDRIHELEAELVTANISHKITLDRETATTARYDTKLEKLEAELAAANRRADEAFNEGVEAAAKFVVATGHSEIATDFHLIKRPTQPEQKKDTKNE